MASTLLIAVGHEGIGKSTLLKAVRADVPKSVLFDADVLKRSFLQDEPMLGEFYRTRVREPTYTALYDLARDNLVNNTLVILDGSFGDKLFTPGFQALAQEVRRVALIYCVCPREAQKERVEGRGWSHDLVRWNHAQSNEVRLANQERLFEAQLAHVPYRRFTIGGAHARPVGELVQSIRTYALSTNLPAFPAEKL